VTLTICATAAGVARHVADRLCSAVRARPDIVLGLPTGRTPIPIYRRLAALAKRRAVDFHRVRTFNLDEFVGLPRAHPASYRSFMERHLFAPAGFDANAVDVLDGLAPDLEAECERYEAAIAAAGGIDIQLLGIGANGHIGFNEPGPSLSARTHRAVLRPQTRRANAIFFDGNLDAVPAEALSMGVATILHARTLLLVATGRTKSRAIAGAIEGAVTTRLPASFVQLHGHAEVCIDEAAASALRHP
jgi:glucosamine-6-phosphate deaminase